MANNEKAAKILGDIADLLELNGELYKPRAYRRAALALEKSEKDIGIIYQEKGTKGLREIAGIGESIAKRIEEYLQKGRIKYYEELKQETAIRQIVTHYFKTKGVSLEELKNNAKKRKIIYSRYTKPAKQLLELAGGLEKAKEAIDKVAQWANSRGLDYAIETVFKKWLELDRLKPKEIVKKPFYDGKPMVWSETRRKWYVIDDTGEWLEYADKKEKIEWRIIK